MGKDWHSACLRCANEPCRKVLVPGSHSEATVMAERKVTHSTVERPVEFTIRANSIKRRGDGVFLTSSDTAFANL
ncbi:hypothetical protein D918_06491 [Trichuris suis]|nr:hypothetical protein D918_06491 [Trichuris suis]